MVVSLDGTLKTDEHLCELGFLDRKQEEEEGALIVRQGSSRV